MYSESDLEAAVAAGALSPEAARQLRDFVAREKSLPAADEEHFRLLTGFNDIFVALATIIMLVAVGWLANTIPPHIDFDGPSPFAGLFIAGVAWSLAEFFTRKRRMALPSIILLLAFVGGVFEAVLVSAGIAIGADRFDEQTAFAMLLAGSAAVAAGAAWLHWQRFRVPITVAAGTAALAALILSLVASVLPQDGDPGENRLFLVTVLLLGIGVFAFAMRWDSSDPRRETRRSDVAFWLHLLAAPMIVHPVFALLGLTEGVVEPAESALVIALYILLGVAAVAVDRRALLVSALAYVLYALNSLFQNYGAVELSFALTALVIGSALLMLSAFWAQTRRAVINPLPEHLKARLAPVERQALSA
ncbi:MAG: hypothetical protein JWL74_604 [Alphaproteobacteria bacterium]|nr:hypothetical protein [Alphaproteobacteria bacterium]